MFSEGGSIFDREGVPVRLAKLKAEVESPGFWKKQEETRSKLRMLKSEQDKVKTWEELKKEVEELKEVSVEEPGLFFEDWKEIEKRLKTAELVLFFDDEYDPLSALVSVYAGAGGTDAQDFTEMLLRMYLRVCEKRGWKAKVLEKTEGEEAGIKSATVRVEGEYAYGWLKGEHGVHRLVRQSPFNSAASRETSFAKVDTVPLLEEPKLKINEDEIRVDVFRAGGHGGQSVNTTDSAVRVTHVPTGITAVCQNERSQLQNKQKAMEILVSRLEKLMREEHAEKLDDLKGKKREIAWGNQIRSYVLHPYKMVKDHRTGVESVNPEKVLDGELEGFLKAEARGLTKSEK